MRFNKKVLLEDLKACLPGIETGSAVLEGADSFIFHDGKIFSYNATVSVSVPLRSDDLVSEKLEGAVRADEFFTLISKLPQDEFELTPVDDSSWNVKCGKMKAQLALKKFDYLARINLLDFSGDWQDITDEFLQGMKVCKMQQNRTPLSGIYFNGKYMISTDSYQINRFEMKKTELPVFWLSDKCCDVFLNLKRVKKIQVNSRWVHLMTEDDSIFSVKPLQISRYPYDKIQSLLNLDLDNMEVKGKFPSKLFEALDRAITFGIESDKGPVVRLNLSTDNIEVSSEKAVGRYEEVVEWVDPVGEFEPMTIYVDISMLNFSLNTTAKFYINKVNGTLPRLIFATDSSVHMFSTFVGKEDK